MYIHVCLCVYMASCVFSLTPFSFVCLFCSILVCLFLFCLKNFLHICLFSSERDQEMLWVWVGGVNMGKDGARKQ